MISYAHIASQLPDLPLMVAVFTHIMDSRKIELTTTRGATCDLEYLRMLGISEIGDLL